MRGHIIIIIICNTVMQHANGIHVAPPFFGHSLAGTISVMETDETNSLRKPGSFSSL